MELLNRNQSISDNGLDGALYRALSCGDLPSAYLISKVITQKTNPATAFNCGLILFKLEEWEKALAELKRAEQAAGNPTEYEISERKLFFAAIEKCGGGILPLDPEAPQKCRRYELIRIKQLIAMCLIKLGRQNEAAAIERFLKQYNIQI